MEGFFEKESSPHRARDSVPPWNMASRDMGCSNIGGEQPVRKWSLRESVLKGKRTSLRKGGEGTGEKGLSIPSRLFSLNPLKVGYPSRVYHVSGYLPLAWKAL